MPCGCDDEKLACLAQPGSEAGIQTDRWLAREEFNQYLENLLRVGYVAPPTASDRPAVDLPLPGGFIRRPGPQSRFWRRAGAGWGGGWVAGRFDRVEASSGALLQDAISRRLWSRGTVAEAHAQGARAGGNAGPNRRRVLW